MAPRFFVEHLPPAGTRFALPAGAARHLQVRRLQPGAPLVLFDGRGGEWDGVVRAIGRAEVQVELLGHRAVDRELPVAVTLALGMPANERMDALVEKATELGVAAIEPLECARSVLRLAGERAERRRAHWQAVATAAAEQSGRTRLPVVQPVRACADALAAPRPGEHLFVLSLAHDALPFATALAPLLGGPATLRLLSGPEGGLTEDEERLARAAGARAVGLGPRTLRADTAPLAALAAIAAALA